MTPHHSGNWIHSRKILLTNFDRKIKACLEHNAGK